MVSIYVPFMLVTLMVTTCQSLLVIILETSWWSIYSWIM
jgi:hypothetical protein